MTDIFAKPYVETKLQSTRPALKWGVPIALVVVVMATAWVLTGGTSFNLRVPLIYHGDGLFILVLIKRVMEGTWLFQSNSMGAPFGSYLYDYPIPDSGSLFLLKWLGRASGSPDAALNLYYLLGFPVTALSAYIVLRKLRVATALSFAGGFIFTILPFHFERIAHLFYTWYFVAPIFVWYAFKIYRGEYVGGVDKSRSSRDWTTHIKHALVLLLLSCFGVYYSFFGALTFVTAGMMRYFRTRSIKSISGAALAVGIVTFGIIANVTPNLINRYQQGVNHEAVYRSPVDAEIYGLKTVQLLLPRADHRFKPFAKVTAKYSTTFPLVNENITSSLGLIGSIGFIALLLRFLSPRIQQDERFFVLSAITLSLLLFCSLGGFSALFAVLITPMIRAWNRASVFIAFTSIAATLIMVQQSLAGEWAMRHLKRWTAAAAVLLCVFAFWDQTVPPCAPCQRATSGDVESDAQFVAEIENYVPKHSSIYQLPYVGFPEVAPVNQLGTYDPAIGYLDSNTLGWSWGGMKGRPGDLFFRALATEPMQRQVEIARRLCFSGIYVDRRGYADAGIAIEAQLQSILGKPPLFTSASKQQIFYDLTDDKHSVCTLPQDIQPGQLMERAGLVIDHQ